MIHSRRFMLSTTALATVLAFAGCDSTSTPTPAQVLADAQGIVSALVQYLPMINTADPKLLPSTGSLSLAALKDDLTQAAALLSGLSTTTAATTSQTTLQKVEGYINLVLDGVAAVATAGASTVLAPYAPIIAAVVALVPIIEQFANGAANTSTKASLRAKALPSTLSPPVARGILRIPTIS